MTTHHNFVLQCRSGEWITKPAEGKHYKVDLDLHVIDKTGRVLPEFELMCESIYNDIQNPEGSGAATLEAIRKVESEESDLEELGGNAWYTFISASKVWFEGQYNQGEGGEVSFEQYKLAVQTYVRFLADRERKPIEVEFPS